MITQHWFNLCLIIKWPFEVIEKIRRPLILLKKMWLPDDDKELLCSVSPVCGVNSIFPLHHLIKPGLGSKQQTLHWKNAWGKTNNLDFGLDIGFSPAVSSARLLHAIWGQAAGKLFPSQKWTRQKTDDALNVSVGPGHEGLTVWSH